MTPMLLAAGCLLHDTNASYCMTLKQLAAQHQCFLLHDTNAPCRQCFFLPMLPAV
jgi:hypothetical protein